MPTLHDQINESPSPSHHPHLLQSTPAAVSLPPLPPPSVPRRTKLARSYQHPKAPSAGPSQRPNLGRCFNPPRHRYPSNSIIHPTTRGPRIIVKTSAWIDTVWAGPSRSECKVRRQCVGYWTPGRPWPPSCYPSEEAVSSRRPTTLPGQLPHPGAKCSSSPIFFSTMENEAVEEPNIRFVMTPHQKAWFDPELLLFPRRAYPRPILTAVRRHFLFLVSTTPNRSWFSLCRQPQNPHVAQNSIIPVHSPACQISDNNISTERIGANACSDHHASTMAA
ncbi:hypothetical protein F5X68DRAFT_13406 [Plectosphaerella plurivora]|uniref:Uncharacterized protein n=1 Tax=Plectosphaerella plurivora TaxID=936078 RepID=A0A9P8VD68_9PEZI|nr:hypothetical protein F5X68DRAFT_13406 [Plectosphaerella plurivora]